VFGAFSDPVIRNRWFVGGAGWQLFEHTLDFRLAGREFSRFCFHDGPEITYDAIFMDIVEQKRIVFAYGMTVASRPLSASLTTIEMFPAAEGTRLTYTEYDAFLQGEDTPLSREEGCRLLLEKLAAELEGKL
jgi:uncharacterized protein YndB with AHSA1/START domain